MAVGARQRGLSVDEVRTLIEWRFPRKDRGGDIGVQLVQANIPDRCGFAAARPRRQHGKFHSPPAYRPLPAAPICLYPRAVAWLSLLKIVRPAEAYVRQNRETGRHRAKRGAVWAKGPGWAAFGPPESKPPPGWVPPSRPFREGVDEGPSHWDERAREVEGTNRHAVERGAEELLRSGATVIPTSFGPCRRGSSGSGRHGDPRLPLPFDRGQERPIVHPGRSAATQGELPLGPRGTPLVDGHLPRPQRPPGPVGPSSIRAETRPLPRRMDSSSRRATGMELAAAWWCRT